MIIIFRPFKIDDFIEVAGVSGKVIDLNIFETHLKTLDNQKLIVPNGNITGNVIKNVFALETRRIDMMVGVSYADDILKVKAVLSKILADDKGVLDDPSFDVEVFEMGDSSV